MCHIAGRFDMKNLRIMKLLFSYLCFLTIFGHISHGKLLVPKNNISEWHEEGDINIGYLLRIHSRSKNGDSLCDLYRSVNIHNLQDTYAVKWTIDGINRRKDILPNITLGFTIIDTCTDQIDLNTLARSLQFLPDDAPRGPDADCLNRTEEVREVSYVPRHYSVAGIVGPDTSRESVSLASVFSVFHIPVMSIFSTSDELTDVARFKYFLSLVPPNRVSILPLIDLILYFQWKYIAILYGEGSYGEYGYKIIDRLVAENNICVGFAARLPAYNDINKLSKVVDGLENNPTAIAVVVFAEQRLVQNLFKYIYKNNFGLERVWLGGESLSSATIKGDHGEVALGMFYTTLEVAPLPGDFRQYIENDVNPWNSDNPWISDTWPRQLNCIWDSDRPGNSTDYRVNCNELNATSFNGTRIRDSTKGSKYYDGTLVYAHALHSLIEQRCPEAFANISYLSGCIQGPALLKSLKNVTVTGANGVIKFGGDGDLYGRYKIWQLHRSTKNNTWNTANSYGKKRVKIGRGIQIGTWDQNRDERLELNSSRFYWNGIKPSWPVKELNGTEVPESVCSQPCGQKEYEITSQDGCCWNCHSCRKTEIVLKHISKCQACPETTWPDDETASVCVPIDPSYLDVDDLIWQALAIAASTSALLAISAICIFILHRHGRVVKATNFPLSMVMLCGVLLASVSAFAFITRPTVVRCAVRLWGFHLSVNLLYTPMFFKTLQIYRIFNGGKKGKSRLKFISSRWQRAFTSTFVAVKVCCDFLYNIMYIEHNYCLSKMQAS